MKASDAFFRHAKKEYPMINFQLSFNFSLTQFPNAGNEARLRLEIGI